MLRILSGESYSSVKSVAVPSHLQQAVTADVPLKSVFDSGIDSIRDLEKSGKQIVFIQTVMFLLQHYHCYGNIVI